MYGSSGCASETHFLHLDPLTEHHLPGMMLGEETVMFNSQLGTSWSHLGLRETWEDPPRMWVTDVISWTGL